MANFYSYRYAQAYYSYLAAVYAYYAYFDAPGDAAATSINVNYSAFSSGYADFNNR